MVFNLSNIFVIVGTLYKLFIFILLKFYKKKNKGSFFIIAILQKADLTQMSAKKVRVQLEEKLSCSLINRKKEIDTLVMEFVNAKNEKDVKSESESSDNEVAVEDIKPKKTAPKRKAKELSESEPELERSTRNTRTRAKPKKVKRKNKTEGEIDGVPKVFLFYLIFDFIEIYQFVTYSR